MERFRAWCERSGLELGAGLELREVAVGSRRVVRTTPERAGDPPEWIAAVPATWIMGNHAARSYLGEEAVADLIRKGRLAHRPDLAEAWPVVVLLSSLPEKWRAYTEALPQNVPSLAASGARISPLDMALLEGTTAHALIMAAKRDLEDLAAAAPGIDLHLLSWARAVYWSRAIRLPGGGPHHDRAGLVPLLDMLNHGTGQGAVTQELEWEVSTQGVQEPREQRLLLRPGVRFGEGPPGSEVFLFYGAKGTADLAVNYGFVSDCTPSEIDSAMVMWGGISWKMEHAQHGLADGLLDAARAFLAPPLGGTERAALDEVYGLEEGAADEWNSPSAADNDPTGREEFLAELDVEEVAPHPEEDGTDLIFDISPEYLGEPVLDRTAANGANSRETEKAALTSVLDACRMRLMVLHRRRTMRASMTHAPLDPCVQGVLDAECGVINSACFSLETLLGFLLKKSKR